MSNVFGIEATGGGTTVVEAGTYDAVLHAIVQYGVHKREYDGKEIKPANMLKLLFEIPELKGRDGKSTVIGKELPALMNERANFYKLLRDMGVFKEPTTEELTKAFGTKESVLSLLGTAVSLEIENFEKKDGTKGHSVVSARRLDPRLPQPEPELEPFIFTFSDPDIEVYKTKLTKFSRKRIMHANNANTLPKEFHEHYITEQEAEVSQPAPVKKGTTSTKGRGVI